MKIRIENGITIISTGDATGGQKNKTGATGVTYYKDINRYRSELTYKYKKYLLGFFDNLEAAKQIREEAEAQRAAGNFLEWYATLEKYQWHKLPRKNKEKLS